MGDRRQLFKVGVGDRERRVRERECKQRERKGEAQREGVNLRVKEIEK